MLSDNGHELLYIFGRNEADAKQIAVLSGGSFTNSLSDITTKNDLVFLAVSDDSIRTISKVLPKDLPLVHTSGNTALNALSQNICGVVWPLYSFTKNKKIEYNEIPFLLETCNENLKNKLFEVFSKISSNVHYITSEERKKVHLAAVFANNFTNHLHRIAGTILSEIPLTFDVLLPMIKDQIANVDHTTLLAQQSGPARRDDRGTIKDHLRMIKLNEDLTSIYTTITNSILKTYHGKKL